MPKEHIAKNAEELKKQIEQKRGELGKIPEELEKLRVESAATFEKMQLLKDHNSEDFRETSGKLTEINEQISDAEDRQAKLPLEIARLERKLEKCNARLESKTQQQFELNPVAVS